MMMLLWDANAKDRGEKGESWCLVWVKCKAGKCKAGAQGAKAGHEVAGAAELKQPRGVAKTRPLHAKLPSLVKLCLPFTLSLPKPHNLTFLRYTSNVLYTTPHTIF